VHERSRLECDLVEPLDDVRGRTDVRVPPAEIDDGLAVLRLSSGDAGQEAGEVLVGQAVEPFRAGAHTADLRRRGRKSHLAARSCPAHDFEVDDEALVLRSAELAQAGDWGAEALAVNRALADHHPDAAGARYRLAVCLEEAGDVLAAQAAYDEFLARRAAGREARVARRRVVILRERARAAAQSSVHAALAHGRKHQRAGDLDRALVWFERAEQTAETPKMLAWALTSQASVLRTERRFADALRLAERAVAAQPSRTENLAAYASLIAILADLGRLDTAREEADLLLDEAKRNRIANATAGRVYQDLYRRTGNPAHRAKANRCFSEANRRR
jgi:tetratricopeptide (TPR) repeat protein